MRVSLTLRVNMHEVYVSGEIFRSHGKLVPYGWDRFPWHDHVKYAAHVCIFNRSAFHIHYERPVKRPPKDCRCHRHDQGSSASDSSGDR